MYQDPMASESSACWWNHGKVGRAGRGWRVEGGGADTHGCAGYSEKFKISLTALGSSGKDLATQTYNLFLISYLEIITDSQDIVNVVQSIFRLISHMVIA